MQIKKLHFAVAILAVALLILGFLYAQAASIAQISVHAAEVNSQQLQQLQQEYGKLQKENEMLRKENNELKENFTKLREYLSQLVLNVNISNAVSADPRLEIVSCQVTPTLGVAITGIYEIEVTVKNIGDQPLPIVYIFLVGRRSLPLTGTYYRIVNNLWMGEIATVTFDANEPFKIVAVAPP